jgi:hypothetical protein
MPMAAIVKQADESNEKRKDECASGEIDANIRSNQKPVRPARSKQEESRLNLFPGKNVKIAAAR